MQNFMEKRKRNNAKFIMGIRDNGSGTLQFLTLSRNGRIELSDQAVTVKRPNQYKPSFGLAKLLHTS